MTADGSAKSSTRSVCKKLASHAASFKITHLASKRAGTLRGLHFQLPPAAQAKLVTVIRGRVLDVVVDVRRGSPTFGRHVSTELSADAGRQLYVPVGFAHGYLTLEDDVVLMYKVSDYYAPTYGGAFAGTIRELRFHGRSKTLISSPPTRMVDCRSSRTTLVRLYTTAIRSRH